MRRGLTIAICALLWSACSEDDPSAPGGTIPIDVFVDTYVDLRVAGLSRVPSQDDISDADRERILAEHGVSAEDLLEFVDVHGPNVPFIATVWDSVEVRYRRKQDEQFEGDPDSVG